MESSRRYILAVSSAQNGNTKSGWPKSLATFAAPPEPATDLKNHKVTSRVRVRHGFLPMAKRQELPIKGQGFGPGINA